MLMRSFCTESVALSVPGCTGFPATFIRDLPGHLAFCLSKRESSGRRRFYYLLKSMPGNHPCKKPRRLRREPEWACYRSWVAALK